MIDLENVGKVYPGRGRAGRPVTALVDATLHIDRGEFIAIVGTSGAGKSTLLQILGLLEPPTTGEYVLNGARVAGLRDAALSRLRNANVGFVFQSFNLLSATTALENVEAPFLYSDAPVPAGRARGLLDRVGLADRVDHFPPELSGGEQQRVAIARALVMHPSLLLADEPTGNLDAATGGTVLALLHELHTDGQTIVLVTHDPLVAARADRTVTLRDGRILETGARE
jgi:putative ABC transport system ATP-binding protein